MSTNLSKIKREKLIDSIKRMRNILQQQPELLKDLSEIENELNRKKYGLVWEEHEENVDQQIKTKIPVFVEDKKLEIITDENKPINFLLEGDNLHSLYLLEKTHKEKIDVIYIDPPYNTGKEFVYNDNLVGIEDGYKHSKWLSFISKRLTIAKKLLKNNGIIFISIDDNEHSQLKLLCDAIFEEKNFIADFSVIRAEGGGLAKQVIKGHDYMLAYCKDVNKFTPLAKEKDIRGKKIIVENIEYWIQEDWFRKEFGKYGNCHYEEILKYKDQKTKDEIDEGIAKGKYMLIKKANDMHIVGKLRRLDEDSSKFYSVLKHLNSEGVKDLKKFNLKRDFDYPKPVSLIKEVIKGATFFKKDKEAIVLDFFAGSGTTAQAVLDLNNEDCGNRKFILCTNDDNKICSEIAYNRMQKIMNGYIDLDSKSTKGLSGNLKYYKTEYIDRFNSYNKDYYITQELSKYIKELVQLENGIDINSPSVQVIFTDEELDELIKDKEKLDLCKILYLERNAMIDYEHSSIIESNNIEICYIPEYYFAEEIMEAEEW